MTREEHIEFCKRRALKYLDRGQIAEAFTSMGSDLGKHPETKPREMLLQLGMNYVIQNDAPALRRWIEGFN